MSTLLECCCCRGKIKKICIVNFTKFYIMSKMFRIILNLYQISTITLYINYVTNIFNYFLGFFCWGGGVGGMIATYLKHCGGIVRSYIFIAVVVWPGKIDLQTTSLAGHF